MVAVIVIIILGVTVILGGLAMYGMHESILELSIENARLTEIVAMWRENELN